MQRLIYLLFIIYCILNSTNSRAQCSIDTPVNPTINCGDSHTLTTTSPGGYQITNTPCATISLPSPTTPSQFPCDDCFTPPIAIGFPFTFYGNTYNDAIIQSNGMVGFGTFNFAGYTPFALPNPSNPNNYIAGILTDIDIRNGGSINYQLIGTAPNRRFVVSYNAVRAFGGGTGSASFQIVLNENNTFQIIIGELTADWRYTSLSSGVENIDGSYAVAIPGRNASDWRGVTPADQDCHTFGAVPGCSFVRWSSGGMEVGTSTNLTISPSTTTNYTAEWLCGTTPCSAMATITVVDTQLPTLTTLPNISRNTDAGVCTFTNTTGVTNIPNGIANDNCSVASYEYVLTGATTGTISTLATQVFNIGATTITWTAKDASNNISASSSFIVTVNDTQLPTLTALSNVSRNTDVGVCTFTNTTGVTNIPNGIASDNCSVVSYEYVLTGAAIGIVSTLATQVFNIGATTVTWTAKDASNNVSASSSFTVTVNDTQIPVVTALPNVSRNADNGVCTFTNAASSIPNGTGTDNCSVTSYSYVLSGATTGTISTLANQVFNVGVTTITWTATDVNSNISASSLFTVTIVDTQNPIITSCPTNVVVPNTATVCGGIVNYALPTATDNCAIASIVQTAGLPSGSSFPPNTTTNTFVVTDVNGNTSTCSFDVTVNQRYELIYSGNGFQEIYSTTSGIIGNSITIRSYACDIFAGAIGEDYVATGKVVISNIPTGLRASIIKLSNTELRFSLLGVATPNTQADNVGNLTTLFNDAAFVGVMAMNVTNASRSDLQVTFLDYIPLNLVADALSTSQIKLDWERNSTAHTNYHLYRGSTRIAVLPITTITYLDENLNSDTFYQYTVVGVTSNGIETDPSSTNEWTYPVAPTLVSVSTLCGNGKAVITLSSSAFIYNVYADSTSTTPLMQSNEDETFQLPFVSDSTTFYVSVIGKDGSEIKESARTAVRVEVQPVFEANILGENNRQSCETSLLLEADSVENATYTWLLNGTSIGLTGQTITANFEGEYQVSIQRGVCNSVSEKVVVQLNQKPTVQIQQQNGIRFCNNGTLNASQTNSSITYEWLLNNVVVGQGTSISISQSGVYTLQATQNGCQASAQIEVTVAPTPQLPILEASETTICPNVETTISVQNIENGAVYQWFRNGRALRETGNSISTSISGNYQVLAVSDANSSCSVSSNELQINRTEVLPIYLRVSEDKKSLFLEDATSSQNEIASVEWYFEGEINTNLGTENQITPAENGSYSAIVTNQNGCTVQTRTVYFSIPETPIITGEEDVKSDVFQVYPNPSKGVFKIQFPTVLIEDIQISIFDAAGKIIHQQVFEKNNQDFVIDIQDLPKGIYLIRFNQNENSYSKSIILE